MITVPYGENHNLCIDRFDVVHGCDCMTDGLTDGQNCCSAAYSWAPTRGTQLTAGYTVKTYSKPPLYYKLGAVAPLLPCLRTLSGLAALCLTPRRSIDSAAGAARTLGRSIYSADTQTDTTYHEPK